MAWVLHVALNQIASLLVDQLPESEIRFPKPALHGAYAQSQRLRHIGGIRLSACQHQVDGLANFL